MSSKFRHALKSLLSGSVHPISKIMVVTIEDLQQLPVSEKIQLVEDLWDSIAAETSPIGLSPQHIAELDYRLDALEKIPATEHRGALFAKKSWPPCGFASHFPGGSRSRYGRGSTLV
jgi:putative addiction module component (TIGR02574 family)